MTRPFFMATTIALLLAACGDTAGPSEPRLGDLQTNLIGEYDDGFSTHHIGSAQWTNGDCRYHLRFIDDEAGLMIADNDSANAFNPGLWSRFDWTEREGALWFCQIAFDAASREAAEAVGQADRSDLETAGCGGFPWSRLSPIESAIVGGYTDDFGGSHTIDKDSWSSGNGLFHVRQVSNEARFIVAQNDVGNSFNPGRFSRFDWTVMEGTVFFCQSAFDAESRAEAANTTAADASQPTVDGCGGFAWSQLRSRP